MDYYYSRVYSGDFEDILAQTVEALKQEGFGILTEIDVQAILKEKLDVDFRRYRILGACNPKFANQALQTEDKIGIMLPCNVIVQEIADKEVEVAVVNPAEAMAGVRNPNLEPLAATVGNLLEKVLSRI